MWLTITTCTDKNTLRLPEPYLLSSLLLLKQSIIHLHWYFQAIFMHDKEGAYAPSIFTAMIIVVRVRGFISAGSYTMSVKELDTAF